MRNVVRLSLLVALGAGVWIALPAQAWEPEPRERRDPDAPPRGTAPPPKPGVCAKRELRVPHLGLSCTQYGAKFERPLLIVGPFNPTREDTTSYVASAIRPLVKHVQDN